MSSSSSLTGVLSRLWTQLVRPIHVPFTLTLVMVGMLVWAAFTSHANNIQLGVILGAVFVAEFAIKMLEASMHRRYPETVDTERRVVSQAARLPLGQAFVYWRRNYSQPLIMILVACAAVIYCLVLIVASYLRL